MIYLNFAMKNNKNYNQKLRSARKKLGITQLELAEKLGSSPSAIGMYEQGRRTPSYETLYKICSILNISSQEFFVPNGTASDVFNITTTLNSLIDYLSSKKEIALNGKLLSPQKKNGIAYILKLILNDK